MALVSEANMECRSRANCSPTNLRPSLIGTRNFPFLSFPPWPFSFSPTFLSGFDLLFYNSTWQLTDMSLQKYFPSPSLPIVFPLLFSTDPTSSSFLAPKPKPRRLHGLFTMAESLADPINPFAVLPRTCQSWRAFSPNGVLPCRRKKEKKHVGKVCPNMGSRSEDDDGRKIWQLYEEKIAVKNYFWCLDAAQRRSSFLEPSLKIEIQSRCRHRETERVRFFVATREAEDHRLTAPFIQSLRCPGVLWDFGKSVFQPTKGFWQRWKSRRLGRGYESTHLGSVQRREKRLVLFYPCEGWPFLWKSGWK